MPRGLKVCEALEQELQRFGLTSASVRYSSDCGCYSSYLLQRWSDTWSNYINVEEQNSQRIRMLPHRYKYSRSGDDDVNRFFPCSYWPPHEILRSLVTRVFYVYTVCAVPVE